MCDKTEAVHTRRAAARSLLAAAQRRSTLNVLRAAFPVESLGAEWKAFTDRFHVFDR